MTNEERDRILQDFLESKSHHDIESDIAASPESNRAAIASLMDVADLLWEAGHGAPPLEADPVAAMLGLIPDPHVALDSRAMSRARKNAKLKTSDVAERLRTRGWDIAVRDVFQWETQAPPRGASTDQGDRRGHRRPPRATHGRPRFFCRFSSICFDHPVRPLREPGATVGAARRCLACVGLVGTAITHVSHCSSR